MLHEEGQQSEREFKEKYGEHNVLFQICDITSSEQIEVSSVDNVDKCLLQSHATFSNLTTC